MLRTGQLPAPHGGGLPPLRPRDLARRRECCYRGPWRLPGPDSHRLAAVSLSLGYVVVSSLPWSSAPELLDAHSAESPAVRHRRPAGAGGVTLAQRDPLATSLRIFDDGMAGSRQGEAYRRGAAGQHRTGTPHRTLRSGFVPTVRAPACAWRSRTPAQACRARCARRCSSASATARPPLPTPRPGYWHVARAPPCPAARWHRLGRGPTRRWLIVPGHLASPFSLTLANRPCRAPQGPSDGRIEAQNLAPLRSRSERLEVSQTSA
jgi:hypothetical protein